MDMVQPTRSGKILIAQRHLLKRHHHEHKYLWFISFLIGWYSCRWKQQQRKRIEPGECCCTRRECAFYPCVIVGFFFSFVFMLLWVEARNDYFYFDWYSYNSVGTWFLWSRVILGIAVFLCLYLLHLLIVALCLVTDGEQLYLHWSHKMGSLLALLMSIIALLTITIMWPREWVTFWISFQVTSPFFHVVASVAMMFLSWPTAKYFNRIKRKALKAAILSPYLTFLILLLFVPMDFFSPCVMTVEELGPKPELIGHRGAPMVAPENTYMSFQKALAYGVAGFETEVQISYDGVPFLMHDLTLARTTNVKKVLPEKVQKKADGFTWEFLQHLNAGEWFIKDKPYANMPPLSPEDAKWARNQTIYKFSDFLKFADRENKSVIFDIYRPSIGHPYRDTWLNRTLDVIINESKIKPHLVLWLENVNRSYVQKIAPGFRQTSYYEIPFQELRRKNIVTLNLDYREMSMKHIRRLEAINITTIYYVINEQWLFSLAWCCGVHAVITDIPHNLASVDRPVFLLDPNDYTSKWIVTDVFSVSVIAIIFGIHWKQKSSTALNRNSGNQSSEDSSSREYPIDTVSLPTMTY